MPNQNYLRSPNEQFLDKKKNPRYIHYFNYINFEKVILSGKKRSHAMNFIMSGANLYIFPPLSSWVQHMH